MACISRFATAILSGETQLALGTIRVNNHFASDCTREVRTEGSRRKCTCFPANAFSITGTVLIWHVSECVPGVLYIYFVKTLEDEFWETDRLMEEVMNCFIISVGGRDSSEEGNDSEDCS